MTDPIPIRREPRIPNPLQGNPWDSMTDKEIEDGIFAAQVRIDAAEHTVRSLTRERERRIQERSTECGAWHHGQPGCICTSQADRHDPRCISLTDGEFSAHCDCATLRMIDSHTNRGGEQ